MPPKAILDARMIRHSGIGTHIRGLLEGWREVAPDFRPALLGDPSLLGEFARATEPYPVIPYLAPIYGLREQLAFPASQTRGALLHCPHYNVALRHRGPMVVTIHDLIHMHPKLGLRRGPKRWYAQWMLKKAALHADHIFAVSKATAAELEAGFGIGQARTTITHNAPSSLFESAAPSHDEIDRFRRNRQLPGEYLLTVGLYKPHKNIGFLLGTMNSLWKASKIQMPLVIAGIQDKDRGDLLKQLRIMGVADHAQIAARLPEAELPLLYAGARAMIHPALLEGFGLPVVEAQAMGCPVAVSNASALPEIAGDGALYFDPTNREDAAERIVEILADEPLRERLVAAGRENAKRFSWRETARKVLEVYEQYQ